MDAEIFDALRHLDIFKKRLKRRAVFEEEALMELYRNCTRRTADSIGRHSAVRLRFFDPAATWGVWDGTSSIKVTALSPETKVLTPTDILASVDYL